MDDASRRREGTSGREEISRIRARAIDRRHSTSDRAIDRDDERARPAVSTRTRHRDGDDAKYDEKDRAVEGDEGDERVGGRTFIDDDVDDDDDDDDDDESETKLGCQTDAERLLRSPTPTVGRRATQRIQGVTGG